MPSRAFLLRIFRFGVVGVLVAGTFAGLNALFGRFFGPQVSFLLSYPPAIAVHFCLNKWWTFDARQPVTARQVGEYLSMVGVTFLIQWAAFTAMRHWTTWPAPLEAALATTAQTAVSFGFMQVRIFGARRPA